MKVSTDSCLFGAWVAAAAAGRFAATDHLLDAGTGTGLLMLMLAQQCDALIDGIEIHTATASEATDNCMRSPWKNRLVVVQGDVRQWICERKYDLIVSNPPFYERSLPSGSAAHNVAHHDAGLTLEQLSGFVQASLKEGGSFAVLLPFFREAEMIGLCAEKKMWLHKRVRIRHAPGKPFIRSMLWFQHHAHTACNADEMSIYDDRGMYSEKFVALLQPYYLHL